ncbi:MAG: DUF4190 domain-containing protein [Jiangellaceae bacterium]|nr:DUF4190 domain-containing protein [Jiangellaceae bacterium]
MSDPYAQPPAPAEPPAQPAAPPVAYAPPQHQQTNGFAIASLLFGIIGGVPLAVIFGIVALVQIPKKRQKGRGLAIAGLVLAGVWTLLIVAAVVLVVATSADRDVDTGEITEPGDVSAFSLEVGDCVNGLDATVLRSLPTVPCDQPHEGEVFAMFDLPEGEYPPEEELFAQADQGCADRLAAFSTQAMDDPAISLFYLYPQEPSWPEDREIVCIAAATSGTTTGSLRD